MRLVAAAVGIPLRLRPQATTHSVPQRRAHPFYRHALSSNGFSRRAGLRSACLRPAGLPADVAAGGAGGGAAVALYYGRTIPLEEFRTFDIVVVEP